MKHTEHAPHCSTLAMTPQPVFQARFQLYRCTTCGATTLNKIGEPR